MLIRRKTNLYVCVCFFTKNVAEKTTERTKEKKAPEKIKRFLFVVTPTGFKPVTF